MHHIQHDIMNRASAGELEPVTGYKDKFMRIKMIINLISILALCLYQTSVFAAAPAKSKPTNAIPPAAINPSSKPDPFVTVSPIKYEGPNPQVTVSKIEYEGPEAQVTVSKIVYEGKTLKFSQPVLEDMSKKRLKRASVKHTPLPPGSRKYKIGEMVPLKVAIGSKAIPDFIFEFQKFDGKIWRKMKQQRLTSPRIVKRTGKITLTRHIKFAKPGTYRWRCSVDKGKSWSAWSKTLEVIQQGVKKKSPRGVKKDPGKNRSAKPKVEKTRITP